MGVAEDLAQKTVETTKDFVQGAVDFVQPAVNTIQDVSNSVSADDIKEAIDLGVKGAGVVVKELINNPVGCAKNLGNLGMGIIQRGIYSPSRLDSFPII